MISPNNPQIDLEKLDSIYQSIENNSALSNQYEIIDFFLNSIGLSNYVKNLLNSNGFENYDSYINERKKPIGIKNKAVDGVILGNILGVISALKDFLSNKN